MSLVRLKIKRDTAANFTASNIVLLLGEWAYETDSFTLSGGIRYYKFKIGDGSTAWVDLPYSRLAPVGGGSGDMTAAVYDPTNVADDAFNMENMAEGATKKILTATERTKLAALSGTNSGDETATGILTKLLTVDGPGSGLDADTLDGLSSAAFAAALGADDNYVTDAEKVKLGNLSGTNTGDQTSIVGITGTKSQFDTAVTDGNFMYIGDAPTAHTHPQSEITNLVTDLGNKQPLDSDLTAIAALTSAADKVPYSTGAGTWALADFTALGRTLLALAGPSAIRFFKVNADNTISLRTAAELLTDIGAASSTFVDAISGIIETPADGTYKLVVKIPFGCTINETVTICDSGTATATFKINTTAMGGTANAVSSSEQTQAQASANTVAAGDDIQVTISSNAACTRMSFTIKITRTI